MGCPRMTPPSTITQGMTGKNQNCVFDIYVVSRGMMSSPSQHVAFLNNKMPSGVNSVNSDVPLESYMIFVTISIGMFLSSLQGIPP